MSADCVGGGVENTMHLLFDCPEYPEIAWKALKDALNLISEKMPKQVDLLIQEFKRNIIAKRNARCINENLNNIIYDKNRVLAHWIIQ